VAIASSSPRSPVAALATPELITTACGSASRRCARETTTGAAGNRFAVNIAVPTAGAVERTTARSGELRRIPARTPAATNPFAAVTDMRASFAACAARVLDSSGRLFGEPRRVAYSHQHSRQAQPGSLGESEREVGVLDSLAGSALAEIVERADHDRGPGH